MVHASSQLRDPAVILQDSGKQLPSILAFVGNEAAVKGGACRRHMHTLPTCCPVLHTTKHVDEGGLACPPSSTNGDVEPVELNVCQAFWPRALGPQLDLREALARSNGFGRMALSFFTDYVGCL